MTHQHLVRQEPRSHLQPAGTFRGAAVLVPLQQEEAEEVLIDDPRGRLSPSQMVDQKLLALLRGGNPGLFLQAAGNLQDIRRIPREQKAVALLSTRLEAVRE